mgnify:FL=1
MTGGKEAIDRMIEHADEAPVADDQRDLEMKVLQSLAAVINSDTVDLKYELLALDPSVFYYSSHRNAFKVMKDLDTAGDHVDRLTMQNGGFDDAELLEAVFNAAAPDIGQVRTYRDIIFDRAQQQDLLKIGTLFMTAVKAGIGKDDRPGLVAELQKAVFDYGMSTRVMPEQRTEAEAIDDTVAELSEDAAGYPTGFCRLDKTIGGLKPGLFIIAGPPSAGKTTYVKQLADQVAEKTDASVLFFAYEQSAYDLRVKSLARLSDIDNETIKQGKIVNRLDDAVRQYRAIGRNMKIIEADQRHTVDAIRLIVQQERHRTGKPPIVIIDYLQIMPSGPAGQDQDRRVQIDTMISEFRRVARDTKASFILVSNMARAEYKDAKMTAFKESGGIEYSADVAAVMKVEGDKAEYRTVSLVILKNRNGRRRKVDMTYQPAIDTFRETGDAEISYLDSLGDDRT